jgi:hypothetical protein
VDAVRVTDERLCALLRLDRPPNQILVERHKFPLAGSSVGRRSRSTRQNPFDGTLAWPGDVASPSMGRSKAPIPMPETSRSPFGGLRQEARELVVYSRSIRSHAKEVLERSRQARTRRPYLTRHRGSGGGLGLRTCRGTLLAQRPSAACGSPRLEVASPPACEQRRRTCRRRDT